MDLSEILAELAVSKLELFQSFVLRGCENGFAVKREGQGLDRAGVRRPVAVVDFLASDVSLFEFGVGREQVGMVSRKFQAQDTVIMNLPVVSGFGFEL